LAGLMPLATARKCSRNGYGTFWRWPGRISGSAWCN